MEKLSKEEVRAIGVGRRFRVSALSGSDIFYKTDELEVGEGLKLSATEWPLKAYPTNTRLNVAHKMSGKKFSVKTNRDSKGVTPEGYIFIRLQ